MVVLWIGLWASDASPAVLLLFAVVAAVVATIVVTIDLASELCAVEWTSRPARSLEPATSDPLGASLRRQIHGAAWSGSTSLHDTLVDVIDERLLAGHQIDRAVDPAAATAVLTPRLRRVIAGQRRRQVVPSELRLILTDIESL